MHFIRYRHLEKLRAFAALMRRWFGFVLLWVARAPFKRSPDDLVRMENRLRLLIGVSVLRDGFVPGGARFGAHRGGRGTEGAWISFVQRSALPKKSAFNYDRLARICHVAANLDRYIARFKKRLARGFLVRRTAKRGTAPLALVSRAPAPLFAFADTS